MTISCEICCESLNKSTRSKVTCPYCPYISCAECSERYLCDTTEDAHCMSCRKGWSREILVYNFTQKFVSKTYKTRRENLLFEREKSMMPATQPYVEAERQIRKLKAKNEKIIKDIEHLTLELGRTSRLQLGPLAVENNLTTEFDASVLKNSMINEIRKIISSLQIDHSHNDWIIQELNGGKAAQVERRQFVRACPYNGCRGFLSSAWKCGLCDNWTCPDCHEGRGLDKDAPHLCTPENIATAKLLAQDSRNCPKCASAIFKIDGCDQMYCVQCHTPFSWRTGRIESGIIHNPHYYDYMRAHGTLPRAPGDVPCGGLPAYHTITNLLYVKKIHASMAQLISAAHRSATHCQWVVMGRFAVNRNNDNRDLRVKFMIGDISDDIFKSKIQQREKARQRKTDISQVLDMYVAVLTDLFQSFTRDYDENILVNSLVELKKHVNDTLADVSRRYSKCSVPIISDKFDVY